MNEHDFIEVTPNGGYLVHALRGTASVLNARAHLYYGTALCGVTGNNQWLSGHLRAVLDEDGSPQRFDDTKRAGSWVKGGTRVNSRRCTGCTRAVLRERGVS